MKTMKRLFALLLTLCLVFGMTNINTYAAEGDTAEEAINEFYMGTGDLSATVPAGKALYYAVYGVGGMILTIEDPNAYVIYNEETYNADEDGVVTVELEAAMGRMPVSYQIGNKATEEKTFIVKFAYPVGNINNPDVLEVDTPSMADIAEGSQGYVYKWTATEDGTVAVKVNNYGGGWYYSVTNLTQSVYGDMHEGAWCADSQEFVSVKAGDVLEITVNTFDKENPYVAPEGTVTTTISYVTTAGTETDPHGIYVQDSYIPVGKDSEVYAMGSFAGMVLVINDADAYIIYNGTTYTADEDGVVTVEVEPSSGMGRPMPTSIVIGNASETNDKLLNLQVQFPLGVYNNPEVIEEMFYTSDDLVLAEGNDQGYYYTYVAEGNGDITFTLSSVTEGVEVDIIIVNTDTYDMYWFLEDAEENEYGEIALTVPVSKGDNISINVVASPDENFVWPAAEVSWMGHFQYEAGSIDNPIFIENPLEELVITVPAGETVYYQGFISGMIMTATGNASLITLDNTPLVPGEDGSYSLVVPSAGMGRMPNVIGITAGEEDATCTFTFAYEEGSYENPIKIEEMFYVYEDVTLEAGDSNGIYYSYIAEGTGTVTFYISAITEGVEADINIMNNTTWDMYSLSGDGKEDEWGSIVLTIPVTVGDEISINVVAIPDENFEWPAAELTWSGSFQYEAGSLENPIFIQDPEEVLEITVPAGETVYYQGYLADIIMTITGNLAGVSLDGVALVANADGSYTAAIASGMMRLPNVIGLTAGDTDATCKITFAYAEGTYNNPEVVEEGKEEVTFTADDDAYYYTFVATEDGKLTVGVNSAIGWLYSVTNMTAFDNGDYSTGDMYYSDDATVVATQTIDVKKGDEIVLMLCAYDPNFTAADNTISLTVDFVGVSENVIPETGDVATLTYILVLMGCALVAAGFVAKKKFA